MMRNMLMTLVMVCGCLAAAGAEKVLAVFPADERPQGLSQAQGVQVEVDTSTSVDKRGSLKITYTGTDTEEVMVFEQPLSGIENAFLWYEAAMRSENTSGRAYLAMWVTFPDQKRYFSRGLDQVFTGTQDWRRCKIPFLLKKGQAPHSVAMGVRFEGPGTVWIDDARLVERPLGWFADEASAGAAMGVIGGVFGALGGIWGGIAGVLTSRGKGRNFVLISGVCLLVIGFACVVAGVYCFAAGAPWGVYYGFLLSGGIDIVVLGPLLPVIIKRYKQVEAQRLAALDGSESL